MFGIDGQFVCEVKIDGKELPIQLGGFDHIVLVENTQLFVPQFRIAVYDSSGLLDTIRAVVNGTPVTIMLGQSMADGATDAYEYRSFGSPKHSLVGGRSLYTIAGTLDAMKYLIGQTKGSFKGHSYECLAKLAQDCGLQTDLDRTNDEMTWLLGRKSHCSVASYVASHGWADNKSMMAMALNSKKTLIYKNLARLVQAEPKVTFWSGSKSSDRNTQIHTMSYDIKSSAGLRNSLFGYGSVAVEQRLDGTTTLMEKTNVTLFSDNLEMNKDVKEQVGRVRSPYLPPDAGNTHDKFQKAKYQNRQALNTFSTQIETMHQQASTATLLDPVNLYISPGGNDSLAKTYNGKYLVTAKTRYIQGSQYYEKHRLMTQGRQNDPTGDLFG